MAVRLRAALRENDNGFTLIELLVVIIIIGILAAIAIPVFLNQRKKGVDASLRADLRNAATHLESYFADSSQYGTLGTCTGGECAQAGSPTAFVHANYHASPNNAVTIKSANAATGYCLFAKNPSGTGDGIYYGSNAGGLLPLGSAC